MSYKEVTKIFEAIIALTKVNVYKKCKEFPSLPKKSDRRDKSEKMLQYWNKLNQKS